jgi:hypothetical protein
LIERAQRLQALTEVLRAGVDPVLAGHITLVNLRDDSAIIAADTPAWLATIRYLQPTFLQLLRAQPGLAGLRQIQFKVQPASGPEPTDPAAHRAALSASGARILEGAAAGIQDPDLARALRRLATRARDNSPDKS